MYKQELDLVEMREAAPKMTVVEILNLFGFDVDQDESCYTAEIKFKKEGQLKKAEDMAHRLMVWARYAKDAGKWKIYDADVCFCWAKYKVTMIKADK